MTESIKQPAASDLSESAGSTPKCPDWILKREGITQRQWKGRKRKELRAILAAFDEYRMGCVYCPNYKTIDRIDDDLRQLKESHSVKEWGR